MRCSQDTAECFDCGQWIFRQREEYNAKARTHKMHSHKVFIGTPLGDEADTYLLCKECRDKRDAHV